MSHWIIYSVDSLKTVTECTHQICSNTLCPKTLVYSGTQNTSLNQGQITESFTFHSKTQIHTGTVVCCPGTEKNNGKPASLIMFGTIFIWWGKKNRQSN